MEKKNFFMINKFNVHNMLAIQNYMSSGSTFLQSLLDGHSHILSTPALYSREIFKIWDGSVSLNKTQLIEFFIEHLPWFDLNKVDKDNGIDRLGKKANEIAKLIKKKFKNIISLLLFDFDSRPSRKIFLQAFHIAYALTLGRKINKESLYILFPIHTSSKTIANKALEDYPNIKFLYTIRDPVVLLNSQIRRHIKLNLNIKYPLPESQLRHLILNKVRVDDDIEVFGDRPYFPEKFEQFKGVRLEDLHHKPRETLLQICKWLQIPFEKNLLKSTFNGKKWWNKPASGKMGGFDKTKNKDKLIFLSKLDEIRVAFLNSKKRQKWGYQKKLNLFSKILNYLIFIFTFFLPFKSELLKLPSKSLALDMLMSYRIFRLSSYFTHLKKIEDIKTRMLFRNYASEQIEKQIGVEKFVEAVFHYDLDGNIDIEIIKNKNSENMKMNIINFKIKNGLEKKNILFDTILLFTRFLLFFKFFFQMRFTMILFILKMNKIRYVDIFNLK